MTSKRSADTQFCDDLRKLEDWFDRTSLCWFFDLITFSGFHCLQDLQAQLAALDAVKELDKEPQCFGKANS